MAAPINPNLPLHEQDNEDLERWQAQLEEILDLPESDHWQPNT